MATPPPDLDRFQRFAAAVTAAFVEAYVAVAIENGFEQDQAPRLTAQLVFGSCDLLLREMEQDPAVTPATLREQVTSPGGTSDAGLKVLMDPETGMRPLLERAWRATQDDPVTARRAPAAR